jgi:hypothetical protein
MDLQQVERAVAVACTSFWQAAGWGLAHDLMVARVFCQDVLWSGT